MCVYIFKWEGKIPWVSDWFIAIVRIGAITSLTSLSIIDEIPSGPALDFVGRLDMSLVIVGVSMWRNTKS